MRNIKKVREIVAAGNMNGRSLRPTLAKVEQLVAEGREDEARAYVAQVSAEVRREDAKGRRCDSY